MLATLARTSLSLRFQGYVTGAQPPLVFLLEAKGISAACLSW